MFESKVIFLIHFFAVFWSGGWSATRGLRGPACQPFVDTVRRKIGRIGGPTVGKGSGGKGKM